MARLRDLASAVAPRSEVQPSTSRVWPSGLDERADALVRLAALVATRAPAISYQRVVRGALDCGVTEEDLVGTVIAVAPTVGLSRLVSASVELALALGYDIDAALECRDPTSEG